MNRVHYFANGRGQIVDTVTIKGPPPMGGRYLVWLFDQTHGYIVAGAWSDPDGNYRIESVMLNKHFFALARDHNAVYQPAVIDFVTAKPME